MYDPNITWSSCDGVASSAAFSLWPTEEIFWNVEIAPSWFTCGPVRPFDRVYHRGPRSSSSPLSSSGNWLEAIEAVASRPSVVDSSWFASVARVSRRRGRAFVFKFVGGFDSFFLFFWSRSWGNFSSAVGSPGPGGAFQRSAPAVEEAREPWPERRIGVEAERIRCSFCEVRFAVSEKLK